MLESPSQCFKGQFTCDVCKLLLGSSWTDVNAVTKTQALSQVDDIWKIVHNISYNTYAFRYRYPLRITHVRGLF